MAAPSLSNAMTLIEEGHVLQATEEISGCFEDQSSSKKLTAYGDSISQNREIEAEQKETLKEIIQGYLALKDDKESRVSHDQSNAAFTQEMSEAQNARSQVNEKMSDFQKELQAVQRELDHLADLQVRLTSHREAVKEETTGVLPKTRYNVSLYRSATKLTWDYNCQEEEVKGYISTSKDVRPFSLDSRQNSKFFITNYLWDLIESTSA